MRKQSAVEEHEKKKFAADVVIMYPNVEQYMVSSDQRAEIQLKAKKELEHVQLQHSIKHAQL